MPIFAFRLIGRESVMYVIRRKNERRAWIALEQILNDHAKSGPVLVRKRLIANVQAHYELYKTIKPKEEARIKAKGSVYIVN